MIIFYNGDDIISVYTSYFIIKVTLQMFLFIGLLENTLVQQI